MCRTSLMSGTCNKINCQKLHVNGTGLLISITQVPKVTPGGTHIKHNRPPQNNSKTNQIVPQQSYAQAVANPPTNAETPKENARESRHEADFLDFRSLGSMMMMLMSKMENLMSLQAPPKAQFRFPPPPLH